MTAPLDFTKISDGEEFEDLCEDLLKAMGFNIFQPERSGRGPDGGRDIIVTELRYSEILDSYKQIRWLVQCKNNSKANTSVKPSEVMGIMDKLSRHKCDGYLLITSTIPSTDLEQDIRGIDSDKSNHYEATFWAKNRLTDEILKNRVIYEKYFGAPGKNNFKTVSWKERNPFIELYSYDESLSPYFFGRSEEVKNLAELVYRETEVLLYGESGVGKSSLLNAGLIPLLKKDGAIVVRVAVTSDLTTNEILEKQELKENIKINFSNDASEMFYEIASELRREEKRLVIYLDQFENLLSSTAEKQNKFGREIKKILEVVRKFRTLTVLFSIRSDYLEKMGLWLTVNGIPRLWNNAYLLRKLSLFQAREILQKVPRLVNAEVSDSLVENIVFDLNEFDRGEIYPVNLQIVATKLFEESRRLSKDSDKKLLINPDVYLALGAAKEILESFINDKLQNFSNKDIAEKILLSFVSPTGRRLSLSSFDLVKKTDLVEAEIIPTLKHMVDTRLLRPLDQPDKYELVHDFLAIKLFHGLEDEKRREKIAKDSFDIAFQAWESEGVLESVAKIDYFYQYRNSLNINPLELIFILRSLLSNRESTYRRKHDEGNKNKCINWLATISVETSVQAFSHIVDSFEKEGISNSDFELFLSIYAVNRSQYIQKTLLSTFAKLGENKKEVFADEYKKCDTSDLIVLKTLQEIFFDVEENAQKELIVLRLISSFWDLGARPYVLNELKDRQNEYIAAYLNIYEGLLSDNFFKSYFIDAIKNNQIYPRAFVFSIELLGRTDFDVSREIVRNRIDSIRKETKRFSYFNFEEILSFYPFEKESTIELLVELLDSKSTRFISSNDLKRLVRIEDTQVNKLFVLSVKKYRDRFSKGSKLWEGGDKRGSYETLKLTLSVIAERNIVEASSLIEDIALSAEPDHVIRECAACLMKIDKNIALKIYVRLLGRQSKKTANEARRVLEKEVDKYDVILNIIESRYAAVNFFYNKEQLTVLLKKINTPESLELVKKYGAT